MPAKWPLATKWAINWQSEEIMTCLRDGVRRDEHKVDKNCSDGHHNKGGIGGEMFVHLLYSFTVVP